MNQLLTASHAAVASGHLTTAQHDQVSLVSEIFDDLPSFFQLPESSRVAKISAVDWQGFLTNILPILMAFSPGLGKIISFIMQIIGLFNGGGPIPSGGTFPVSGP